MRGSRAEDMIIGGILSSGFDIAHIKNSEYFAYLNFYEPYAKMPSEKFVTEH